MAIPTTQARAELTKDLIEVYKEMPRPTGFFQSFFTEKISATRYVSIAVQRGSETVAVDVERGTDGNRNTMGRSSEKIFDPPIYKEYFDITELRLYDALYNSTDISAGHYGQFLQDVADGMGMLEDKIKRAYEVQASQVLQTGIVTLNNGTNIDFKRKAASILDLNTINANRYWTVANDSTATPIADLETGAVFLRQYGKVQTNVFNVIMGTTALANFKNQPSIQSRLDIRRIDSGMLRPSLRDAVGAIPQGEFAGDNYIFRLWSYPEYYDNAAGVSTPYLDPTYVIIMPDNPNFKLSYAAVPQLLTDGQAPVTGAFFYADYMDQRKKTHDFEVASAGITIPVAVDQVYTVKVNA